MHKQSIMGFLFKVAPSMALDSDGVRLFCWPEETVNKMRNAALQTFDSCWKYEAPYS